MSNSVRSKHTILVFTVEGRRYGLRACQVVELLRAVTIVPLPKAPAVVKGVINLRGEAVPVYDIRARFTLSAKPVEPSDHLIVAWAGARRVALWVDGVVDLVSVDLGEQADAKGIIPNAEYIRWIVALPEELLLIHDLESFLSRGEAAELESTLAETSEILPTGA